MNEAYPLFVVDSPLVVLLDDYLNPTFPVISFQNNSLQTQKPYGLVSKKADNISVYHTLAL